MRAFQVVILGLLLCALVADPASAQDRLPEGTVRVTLVDGSTLVGVIQSESDATVLIRTAAGLEVQIPRAQIRSIHSIGGQQFSRIDPNSSRLLFAPSARPLQKGRGYFADYELFFPFVAYGATSQIILAGGISLLPGAPGQLLYLAPKATLHSTERAAFAAGALINIPLGFGVDDDIVGFGVLYGVGTFGSDAGSVSVGAGLGFVDDEFAKNPAIMVGGQRQISDSVSLISENYVIVGIDDAVILSGGVRFFGERLSTDIAFVTVPVAWGEGGFPFFPWLGFAYNW